MGLFDKLRNNVKSTNAPALDKSQKSVTFTFGALPESLDQLKSLPEASLDTPFKTAALAVCALCALAADFEIGKEMLNFLKGPEPLSNMDISFLKDRFTDQNNVFIPFSYFDGAKPENDYTPSEPFTLTLKAGPYAYDTDGYVRLDLVSNGADSPRPITLRQKGDQWFLNPGTEKGVMVGIRKAKSLDKWA